MAWNPPAAFTSMQVLSASHNNAIRESLQASFAGMASARGQLAYADGANSLAMLDFVANRVLRGGSTAPSWGGLQRSGVDLSSNANDALIPTLGAFRELLLPMAGLYESIRSGFTLTFGTDVDVNLPSGMELDDYRWVSFIAGDSNAERLPRRWWFRLEAFRTFKGAK